MSRIAKIKKVRGNKKKERVAWEEAVRGYVEARTAAGAAAPGEFLIHFMRLDDHAGAPPPYDQLGCSDEEDERWTDMLLDIDDAS